ncbi:hypothetical protein J7E25_17410 [Agromyces sp. ISL-38]|uniref:hypothetical protein n=1 Tax=Agromyces sp. ISL-38 TaxID=2819107 RepID=UPI001BE62176|nr:hypothetical protein [Agromyces sp. ISL-38]MBT2500875.1 hypothetical protein [Agromyces sp. ISL-38]
MSIGLDVHARSAVATAIDERTGEVLRRRFGNGPGEVLAWVRSLPQPAAVTYEAGPRRLFREAATRNLSDESDFAQDLALIQARESTFPQAVSMLNYAFDSGDVLAGMWATPEYHVPSDYVLMRAMLDNLIRTFWLLDQVDARERNVRAWLLARDAPARSQSRNGRMLKANPERSIADELRTAAVNAKNCLKELDNAFAEAVGSLPQPRALQPEEFITVAERQPFHDVDGGVDRFWSQLSEIVHGSITPTEYRLDKAETVGQVRVTRPNIKDLALAAGLVTRVLDGALELFYARIGWDGIDVVSTPA